MYSAFNEALETIYSIPDKVSRLQSRGLENEILKCKLWKMHETYEWPYRILKVQRVFPLYY
jgi:hypothetical protein